MHRRALLSVAATGVLAACSSTHAHPAAPTSSTVATASRATASAPGKPATLTGTLEAVGGPAGASPNPLPGLVAITGPVTENVTVGLDGKYTATLPPGPYAVTGTSPQYNDGQAACRTDDDTVTLIAGQSTTADVLCQEK